MLIPRPLWYNKGREILWENPAGIRYTLFGDRLCRLSFLSVPKVHTKLLVCQLLAGSFQVLYSVVVSALVDIMSRSRYSVVRGINFLPADLPTVKGIVHLCFWSDFHVVQMLHIVLNVKGVFLVIIGQLLVSAMLRYIEFIRE